VPKRAASLDASFWINAWWGKIVHFLLDYFVLFTCSIVAEEIQRPSSITGKLTPAGQLFQNWLKVGRVQIQDPKQAVEWFHPGENAAVGLAIEYGYTLLIDDKHPYHLAKARGVQVIATPEFTVLLYIHGHLSYQVARSILSSLRVDKRLIRRVQIFLATLARERGNLQ
jgi:predicted nucleic acid-binding protein